MSMRGIVANSASPANHAPSAFQLRSYKSPNRATMNCAPMIKNLTIMNRVFGPPYSLHSGHSHCVAISFSLTHLQVLLQRDILKHLRKNG